MNKTDLYKTPDESAPIRKDSFDSEISTSTKKRSEEILVAAFLIPFIGGIFNSGGYILSTLLIETFLIPLLSAPVQSYGQMFAVITLYSGAIGFFGAAGISIFLLGFRRLSIVWTFGVSIIACLFTTSLWRQNGIVECPRF